MNTAEKALRELQELDELAAKDSPAHRLAPLTRLLLTLSYIAVTVSFGKYALTGLLPMVLFPAAAYRIAGVRLRLCFRKLGAVMPLVCAVGLLNPLFDRQILLRIGGVGISGGVISMLTLMLKGVCCLTASFLLAATTPIEGICAALRRLHVPRMAVTLLMLTCRYVSVLLEQAAVMSDAYHLRAPGQKGIHWRAWGSFLGQLLLRSADRAQVLYESMTLRGYTGDFPFSHGGEPGTADAAALFAGLFLMLAVRQYDLTALVLAALR